MTISNDSRDRVKHAFEPIALAMGRAGLTPDALTLIGFAITVVGAGLLSQQLWLAGGVVVLLGGIFDMFDGTLARATGKVSSFGAFMDSVFDRWGESIVYLGIVIGCLGIWGQPQSETGFTIGVPLAAAALGGSFMVSYARAKAEGLGFATGTGMASVGLMPREVRLVILCLGLILGGLIASSNRGFPDLNIVQIGDLPLNLDAGHGVIAIALAVIAIGSTVTVIQRILHVRSQAIRQSTTPQAGVPASNGETNT
jgi:CDP-diacylglycerol--glycerol-3-phosphate 3-phosphatidyltransferase